MNAPSARRDAGFSLIEVIVALGLLAGVLLSVAGLFLFGERQVRSGRNHSAALAAAQTMIEEISGWHHDATWSRFGLAGNAAAYTVDSRVNSFASAWQTELASELADGRAEIRLESCDGSDLEDADAVRVVVSVFWNEQRRARRVDLAMLRL